jgi:hypothetical protein
MRGVSASSFPAPSTSGNKNKGKKNKGKEIAIPSRAR